jgi:outer membrane biosynthesis protein TonB
MMVNILRRSKAGASLDDAIVAAVKKWTFAPAKRRGEAVSCWYHVGVPVANAN